MDSIHFIRENLIRSESIVLARIEDMRDHCLVPPSLNGGCHTLWILGHLAYIEGLVVSEFMQGQANPLAHWKDVFDGDEVSMDADGFPPFDLTLKRCREIRASTLSTLESLCEQDLDQPSSNAPHGTEKFFGTYRHCFQYCADHWLMHRGQLANARSAAGEDLMWY